MESTGRVARAALALTAAAAVLASASGCLITQRKQQSVTGASVTNAELARVQPGSSTPAEVEGLLGPPTTRTTLGDGELWNWRWEERSAGSGAVFLVFGGSDSKVVEHSVSVEFRHGVVSRKWRD